MNKQILAVILGILLIGIANADIISVNSGGGKEIVIIPTDYVEGFFTGELPATFHFGIDCPEEAYSGDEMICTITAQLTDPRVSPKKVDFTCYISTEEGILSSLNFNEMVTTTTLSIQKSFDITGSLTLGESYTLQCEASYDSLTDNFYDIFTVAGVPLNPDQIVTGGAGSIIDKGKEFISDITSTPSGKVGGSLLVLLLVGGLIFFLSKQEWKINWKKPKEYYERLSF